MELVLRFFAAFQRDVYRTVQSEGRLCAQARCNNK